MYLYLLKPFLAAALDLICTSFGFLRLLFRFKIGNE